MGTLDRWWPFHSERRQHVGLNSHMLRPLDRHHLRELNVRQVRVPGILQEWERDPSVILDMDRAARQDGVRLLWVLHNVTDGTPQPADSLWHGEQWAVRMTEFCRAIARLPATEAVQPWNEPNGYKQQPFGAADGFAPVDIGATYAAALRLHAEAIRETPGVRVVAAGLARLPGWDDCLYATVSLAGPVDAYAVHAYGPWSKAEGMIAEAKRLLPHGAPLWVTEFGNDQQNGEPFDAERHTRAWSSFVQGVRRRGDVERMYGYVLQTDPREWYMQHGLFDLDGSPRPAYTWLKGAQHGI